MTGFILLHRKITEWEWYQNPNTFRVFLHCLLMANYSDGRFEGRDVKRGQFVTSLPKLSVQTKLSVQQVRTALKHLISTGEITDEGTSQYRVITIVKYDEYQKDNRQINSQSTDDQQTVNRQSTDNQQQYKKNNKETKKQWNNDNNIGLLDAAVAHEIQEEQNRVLDAAEDAGFRMSNDVRTALIDLYAVNGLQKMLDGLKSCVRHGVLNLAYLEGCMKDQPKKTPVALVPGSVAAYDQRDYSGETEAAIERMMAGRLGNGTA